jgi:hypothetical protein
MGPVIHARRAGDSEDSYDREVRGFDIEATIADVSRRPGVADLLRRLTLDHELLREETDSQVVAELPGIAERADAAVRRELIDATFRRVLDRLSGGADTDGSALHRSFGAAAAVAGVALHELTAAYRVGSRVAWAHVRRVANEVGVDADTAMVLAQAHFACVDELTADSVHGYSDAIEAASHLRARDRQNRLQALLDGTPAAEEEGWTEPVVAAVVHGDAAGLEMHDDVLAGTYDGAVVVVGQTRRVALVLADWDATIGSSGTVAELPRSFRRARQLFSLVASGALVRSGPVRWSDELAAVVVHAAPDAADELARRRLGPLADSNAARERWLVETLRAWLDTPGRPQAIAERLYLHPQTVRYRLRRLRERLGDDIDDPAARFEFAIALQFRDGRAGSVRVPRSEGAWQEH